MHFKKKHILTSLLFCWISSAVIADQADITYPLPVMCEGTNRPTSAGTGCNGMFVYISNVTSKPYQLHMVGGSGSSGTTYTLWKDGNTGENLPGDKVSATLNPGVWGYSYVTYQALPGHTMKAPDAELNVYTDYEGAQIWAFHVKDIGLQSYCFAKGSNVSSDPEWDPGPGKGNLVPMDSYGSDYSSNRPGCLAFEITD